MPILPAVWNACSSVFFFLSVVIAGKRLFFVVFIELIFKKGFRKNTLTTQSELEKKKKRTPALLLIDKSVTVTEDPD